MKETMQPYVTLMTDSALEEEINRTAHLRNMQNTKLEILQEQKAERARIKEREAKQAEIDKYLPGTEWVFLTIASAVINSSIPRKGEIFLLRSTTLIFDKIDHYLDSQSHLTIKNLLKNGVRVWYAVQGTNKFRIFLRK